MNETHVTASSLFVASTVTKSTTKNARVCFCARCEATAADLIRYVGVSAAALHANNWLEGVRQSLLSMRMQSRRAHAEGRIDTHAHAHTHTLAPAASRPINNTQVHQVSQEKQLHNQNSAQEKNTLRRCQASHMNTNGCASGRGPSYARRPQQAHALMVCAHCVLIDSGEHNTIDEHTTSTAIRCSKNFMSCEYV
jgi:hypothetical protein